MTFFFDNNLSPKLAQILSILYVNVRHLRDDLPANVLDTTWIPYVGTQGWVAVTSDKHIRINPAELAALRQHQVTALIFKDFFNNKQLWGQAEWLLRHWQIVEQEAEQLRQGTLAAVKENGRLEIFR